MDNNNITFKVTLTLDEEWSTNQGTDEVVAYIRDRLDTTLGFRGEVKKLRVVTR
jgi:hypothetical protein